MPRPALWFALTLAVLLAAGCGQVPTAGPAGPATPPGPTGYPPPPTFPTRPPATAGPEVTAIPTTIPTPTTLPVPVLAYQPVPAELRQGERIAFLRDGDLWLVRPDGSALAQVTTSGNVTALYGWSPDCTRVLLGVGNRPVPPESDMPGGTDLWVLHMDSSGTHPLVQGLEVLSAQWSPAGEQIAYETRDGSIYIRESDGTALRIALEYHSVFGGSWSPDGTQIAFQYLPLPGDYGRIHLAILDLTTDSLVRTRDEVRIDSPPFIWSVDGKRILFQSGPGGDTVWRQFSLEGNELVAVRNEDFEQFVVLATGLSRSPVADQVAFGYYRFATDTPAVWVMDLDGGNLRKLADGINPTWSPDGNRVAYAGSQGGLWVVNLDGSAAVEVAEQGQSLAGYEPRWCR